MLVFINNNFFFLSANIIGLWALVQELPKTGSDRLTKSVTTINSSAIDITENIAMNKGVSLSLELDEEMLVNADRNMVNTILRNLISNAIKYTHRGGKIVVKAISQNDLAKISIIDNGVGIAPDILEKLFKISEKISTPGTEKEPGTGLGLVLCKEFVEKHGGQLRVSSELEKGSEFFFELQLVRS